MYTFLLYMYVMGRCDNDYINLMAQKGYITTKEAEEIISQRSGDGDVSGYSQ